MSMSNARQPPKFDLEIFKQSDYHYREIRNLNSKTFKVIGNDLNPLDRYCDFSEVQFYKINDAIQILRDLPIRIVSKYQEKKMKTLQSSITEQKQYYIGNNSFIQAALFAYSNHQHLVIRPDDVWIAIMTQLSFYITNNAEELRSKIVDFQGKKDLEIVVDATIFKAPYDKMTLEMANLISNNIKDQSLKDWVIPNFSTTNDTDRVVGASVLMSSMKEYLNYKVQTSCGLPAVTMMGTLDDWKSIKVKAQNFMNFHFPMIRRRTRINTLRNG